MPATILHTQCEGAGAGAVTGDAAGGITGAGASGAGSIGAGATGAGASALDGIFSFLPTAIRFVVRLLAALMARTVVP